MYRAIISFALLALCLGAPYSDINAQRSFSNRQEQQLGALPSTSMKIQQDETELVDTLGGGYSFFKKQPIVSRPLIQQKLAINEQQVPITSFDDSSNQWSDYTKASAFKQQPVQHQTVAPSNDFLIRAGYGEQQSVPRTSVQVLSVPSQIRTTVSTGYGNQQQDDFNRVNVMTKTIASDDDTYGSSISQGEQQPSIRNLGNSYGQQEVRTIAQPLVRNLGSSYGQQQVEIVTQEQPLIRNLGNSYGQQEVKTILKPLVRTLDNSYGQQQQIISQEQPSIRNLGNSYGQQEVRTIAQPLVRNLGNSYGQQQEIISQEQPSIRNLGNSYGQQEVRTILKPLVRTLDNSYGQQQQIISQEQPSIRNFGNSYGQQEVKTILRPLVRTLDNSYGQQQEIVPQEQPLIRNLGNTYGQQDLQPSWTVKSNNGYGQQVQEKMISPIVKSTFTSQLPVSSSVQWSEPSFSVKQNDFTRQSGPVLSSQWSSQSRSSDSDSTAGW